MTAARPPTHVLAVCSVYSVKAFWSRTEDDAMYTRHTLIETTLGEVTLVATGEALVGLYFGQHWYRPAQECFGASVTDGADRLLSEAADQLREYLNGDRTGFDLRIATSGDVFEERVWHLVKQIPRGETTTYGELAEKLGDKSQAQLVGKAVGRNPLCVIIPCHRVVGADGRLTGYAGGLRRKQHLLDLEEPITVKADRLF
jgi:methylated-DNA-[protein]-cysteine S-methyltransferase